MHSVNITTNSVCWKPPNWYGGHKNSLQQNVLHNQASKRVGDIYFQKVWQMGDIDGRRNQKFGRFRKDRSHLNVESKNTNVNCQVAFIHWRKRCDIPDVFGDHYNKSVAGG